MAFLAASVAALDIRTSLGTRIAVSSSRDSRYCCVEFATTVIRVDRGLEAELVQKWRNRGTSYELRSKGLAIGSQAHGHLAIYRHRSMYAVARDLPRPIVYSNKPGPISELRIHWANRNAGILTDDSQEAAIQPGNWGRARVVART